MEDIITSYCHIKNNSVSVNGHIFFEEVQNDEPAAFLSSLYKKLELNYPKFFKMDKLCKLGILAADLLIRNTPDFESFNKKETALVFSNHSSSLESDRAHVRTIQDKQNYFPSPSVFVYTLPNIVIGEIAIKYKITGENAFFISESFDPVLIHDYTSMLLLSGSASAALCGWINADGNSLEAFVYCVKKGNFKDKKNNFEKSHQSEIINQLYTV
jgi:hypothetical protein